MKSIVDSERTKSVFLLCLALLCMSLFLTSYLCPDQVCGRSARSLRLVHSNPWTSKEITNSITQGANKLSFDQIFSDPTFTFSIKDKDVIVFLHIQKTGEY